MAAIAASVVSLYPTDGSAERYRGSVRPRETIQRRLKITGVTAADTASAAVLGLKTLHSVENSFGATAGAFPSAVDPVNNQLLVGAGPSNETIYVTVTGTPA
jgi:hypothetical protein